MNMLMAAAEMREAPLEEYEAEFQEIDAFLHYMQDEVELDGIKAINGKYGFWMGYQSALTNYGKRMRTRQVNMVHEAAKQAREFAKSCHQFQLRLLLDAEEIHFEDLRRLVRTALIREPSPKIAFVFSRNDDQVVHSNIDRLRP